MLYDRTSALQSIKDRAHPGVASLEAAAHAHALEALAERRRWVPDLDLFVGYRTTGGEIQFADRAEIEAILQHAQPADFPVRDLLHAVVQSKLFRHR